MVLGVSKSNRGRLLSWFGVLFARHSFAHKSDGPRFLVCSRYTEAQVTLDISEILGRSLRARTKERSSLDRIQPSVSVGNHCKGLLGRQSVISAEIESLSSFLSDGSGNRSCGQARCPIYLHQCIVDQKVILLAFSAPRKRVCRGFD